LKTFSRYCLAGLLLLLPTWATYLVLSTLFRTIDGIVSDVFGPYFRSAVPGLDWLLFLGLILVTGATATHVIGQGLVRWTESALQRIPLVRSIYVTLKGMTDLLNFRSRFGRSAVAAFPFPREGLWALGLVMGAAPASIQQAVSPSLVMVFVPTAIHPFTGYLAFVPNSSLRLINLPAEEAMKMEFSAGLYKPVAGWLANPLGNR
jgi:uncharacterized membrane protein